MSKWVFRHNLNPEQLKEIIQKRKAEGADDEREETAGEEGKCEEEQSQEDADRTAGVANGTNSGCQKIKVLAFEKLRY